MTHEPECTYDWKSATPYCTCSALHAAYQRGRENERTQASDTIYAIARIKAIAAAQGEYDLQTLLNQIAYGIARGDTIDERGIWTAAARGDGE